MSNLGFWICDSGWATRGAGAGRSSIQNPESRIQNRAAITLPELLVTVSIIVLLLSITTLSFRALTESNAMTSAVQTLTNYAAVARSYAIEHDVETMLVVNPVNGRLEIWHLNPPPGGGAFDELSGARPNGYRFAPVLDNAAALPLDRQGAPLVRVHPIDFAEPVVSPPGPPFLRDLTDNRSNRDNLNWAALCFDASGRIVQRTRRIATRTQAQLTAGQVAAANRRADGTPDTADLVTPYEVNDTDSLITSTYGFIMSDRQKFDELFFNTFGTTDPPPADLVNLWLGETPPNVGARHNAFKRKIVFNRFSADELAVLE